jgi:thymidine kinase
MENIFHAPLRTKKGQIQLIFGPMFSGKSSELMRRIVRYQYANKKCLAVKYAKVILYVIKEDIYIYI